MRAGNKDRLWKRYKELKTHLRDRMITKTQMWTPSDYNVEMHMKETKLEQGHAQEFKKVGKELGENTNKENFRPIGRRT